MATLLSVRGRSRSDEQLSERVHREWVFGHVLFRLFTCIGHCRRRNRYQGANRHRKEPVAKG